MLPEIRCAYSAVMVHCKKSWVWTVRQFLIPWLCSQPCTTFWVRSDGRTRDDTSSRVRCLPGGGREALSLCLRRFSFYIVRAGRFRSTRLNLPYCAESGSDTSRSVSSNKSTFCCLRAKVSSRFSVGSTRPTWVQSSGILKKCNFTASYHDI